jgi:hypothetical protein
MCTDLLNVTNYFHAVLYQSLFNIKTIIPPQSLSLVFIVARICLCTMSQEWKRTEVDISFQIDRLSRTKIDQREVHNVLNLSCLNCVRMYIFIEYTIIIKNRTTKN